MCKMIPCAKWVSGNRNCNRLVGRGDDRRSSSGIPTVNAPCLNFLFYFFLRVLEFRLLFAHPVCQDLEVSHFLFQA